MPPKANVNLTKPNKPLALHTLYEAIVENFSAEMVFTDPVIYASWQKRYYNDPVGFAKHCIAWPQGNELTSYQADILGTLNRQKRICVRSLHGAGKTGLAAIAVLWFALTRDGKDWKVITTASAWRQLTKYLWPEIHKWSRLIKWEVVGRPPLDTNTELFTLSVRLKTGEAFAVASSDSAYIEGAHADHLLYVFDESKVVPDSTWDSAEGAFSAGDCMFLAVSTPGAPLGRFYDIQTRKPGFEDWAVRHIKLQEAVEANRINADWANQRRLQWGPRSARYRNRVLGEFAQEDIDVVIPLDHIEQAQERWLALQDTNNLPGVVTHMAADIARFGSNATVIARRAELVMYELLKYEKQDTMQTAGQLNTLLRTYPTAYCAIDVIGVGAGTYDRLQEQFGPRVMSFVASAATDYSPELADGTQMRFVDLRSAAWWYLREMLDPANNQQVALPPDEQLVGDLSAPTYRETSNGRIRVESKDAIAKRLGRSTDSGDAVVMCFWNYELDAGMDYA